MRRKHLNIFKSVAERTKSNRGELHTRIVLEPRLARRKGISTKPVLGASETKSFIKYSGFKVGCSYQSS